MALANMILESVPGPKAIKLLWGRSVPNDATSCILGGSGACSPRKIMRFYFIR